MLPERNTDLNKKDVLVLELVDRANSGFVLEGSESSGHPVHIDGPTFRRIIPASHVMWNYGTEDEPRWAPRKIRHIQGAKSIFADEQDRDGYKFDPKRDDTIFFKGIGGVLTIIRQGRDINKFDFLKACEFSFHATADLDPETGLLPEGKLNRDNVVFREVRAEEIATTDVSHLRWQKDALEIVSSLYTEIAPDQYTYDIPRMNVIAHAVNIPAQSSPAELLVAINDFAQQDPKRFVQTMANRTTEIKAYVNESIQLGVIDVTNGDASLKSNGQIFFRTDARARKAQVEAISQFLLTPDGSLVYINLQIDLEAERARQATGQSALV